MLLHICIDMLSSLAYNAMWWRNALRLCVYVVCLSAYVTCLCDGGGGRGSFYILRDACCFCIGKGTELQ